MMEPHNSSDGGGSSYSKVKRAESSGVSMETDWTIQKPLIFSCGGGSSELCRMKTQRSVSPVTSCMSMKSEDQFRILTPLQQSVRLHKPRKEPPGPSWVSMKSHNSMYDPPNFSNRAEPPQPSWVSMKSHNSMYDPPNFSNGAEPSWVSMKSHNSMYDPPNFSNRAEPTEPSWVSMKSHNSMYDPPNFSNRAEPPQPSWVSMKSHNSMYDPPNLSNGAEPSWVSMKSHNSMYDPPTFSNGAECLQPSWVSMKSHNSMYDPPTFSNGAECLQPSWVSMKSHNSMYDPPNFSNGAEPSWVSMKSHNSMYDPPTFSNGAECLQPSWVSMKSHNSMYDPPNFSNRAEPTEPSWVSIKGHKLNFNPAVLSNGETFKRGKSNLLQDQSRCGLCEQLLTDPVSITCGHSFCRLCINRYWDEIGWTGDFTCPFCRKGSKTCPALHPHTEESIKLDFIQLEDVDIHSVIQKHKTCMKNRYESLFEGIKTQENRTLLNRIYTQLYIIEGESEGVNEEHEIIKMEKTSNKYLQETPINCLDIFRPVEDPEEKMEGVKNTAVMDNSVRQNQRKEDKGPKELRTVLTKGIAGIGKTVSVQKFILDWAEGTANQDVDFMFVLPFRELNLIKNYQYSLYTLLCTFHPELKDMDSRICDGRKVVFIFDGLDESRIPLNFSQCEKMSDITTTSSVGVLMTNLLKGELLPSAHIWITSRPAAANQIPPQYINRVTEIQGFNDPQKEEYFRKRISDQDQAQKIISHIKTARSLHIMCHIPVFCWISATVLQRIMKQSNTEIPKTLTEMYSHFLITQTNMKNEKYEENLNLDPVELLKSNRAMLLKLSELAFKQLMKGNVMFYEEDLRKCGIDVTEASVYSGICTEIFREECVLYQRKVYSFVHLSFQEFLAAFYVFHCYLSKNVKELRDFKRHNRKWPKNVSLHELLKGAVSKASKSQNGHLDLFLRFLLGISLDSSQKILQGLLIHTERTSQSINKTAAYIKDLISTEDLNTDRSVNLFLCLTEMNDQDLPREIQKYINSDESLKKELSALECLALSYMLQTSEEVLEELDLKKYSTSRIAYMKLLPAVNNCRKALLAGCDLTMKHCETICCALKSESSTLKELYLSNNNLQDSGVELLSAGLRSSHCKLETLRLAGCDLTMKHCETICCALKSESSTLKELDLSNNNLQDSGVELLSAGLKSSHCKLETLRLVSCNLGQKTCANLESVLNLESSCLKNLDLSYNDLQDSGVDLLCAGLQSSRCHLETLRLAGCDLTMKQCETICCTMKSESFTLKELDLSNNDLQDSGVELLFDGLQSSHCILGTLRLAMCNLGVKACENLASVVSLESSCLKELDLSNNNLQDSGLELLSAGLKSSHCELQILRLAMCNLGVKACENLASVVSLESSCLKELDLSNNNLQDSGLELLSAGLKSSHCELQILRLSGCMVSEKGCSSLAAALSSNPSHLKELDLTFNHPGESGQQLFSARLEDPGYTVRMESGGVIRMKPGLKKWFCDFTLDPNTVNPRLSLSEENRRVERGEELQSYPDHPERFDRYQQVLSRERVTGRCYWEAEWSGERGAAVALSYKTISRKGGGSDCQFGGNINSWSLYCSDNSYTVLHNKNRTVLPPPPSGCRRVGVYVDCPAGTLSFYRVSTDTPSHTLTHLHTHSHTPSHTLTHLHTLYTTFTQPLYAGIGIYGSGSSVTLCKIE
ncbi:NACHT, LRR and PYD domains-containing protein 12-like isoform X3 [Astyanax mexicanus]|uniref:NACHT, LRR and PYD domains-containing protein 12-like isoform X3 n=1 Tax=Astyanax mexicanus TaxID=7994 RepID=UPI0020CADAC7|nr:NACHT, LRR and PYD domains-containing protein 12-like isoform X3 [Astyanax mexicanus]